MPSRRDLLASGAVAGIAGFSGCIGDVTEAAGVSNAMTRTLSVAEITDAPDEHGISFDVEIESASLNDGDLPELTLEVENTGPQLVAFSIWFRYRVGQFSGSEPNGLYTITTEEADRLDLDSDGCWSLADDERLVREDALYDGVLESGETQSDVRHVIQHGDDVDDCLATGEYRFSSAYEVYDLESEEEYHEGGGEDGERVECGFTLAVTDEA
ncbi:hypothetical protein OB905_04540 [Halobacteria archaeon AArc-dxtr1]|nr:hypothetical protein [Halobacteria archaeon AArc-dxtr1]